VIAAALGDTDVFIDVGAKAPTWKSCMSGAEALLARAGKPRWLIEVFLQQRDAARSASSQYGALSRRCSAIATDARRSIPVKR
jgi:hypothetical protein